MKEESNSLSVPYTFARCFNAQCTQAENCLRRMATLNDTNKHPYITIVNPDCIPENTSTCPHFKTVQKMHVAWGVKRLLDKLSYTDAISTRKILIGHFGKNTYYRFHREERYLSPEDQSYIRRIFRQKGITEESHFEHYTDEYNW